MASTRGYPRAPATTCSGRLPKHSTRVFVEKVDIGRAIQYMNDNIGGSSAVLRRDAGGRAVHQAERNLYLPQPNWLVLFGGDIIDVEKIELLAYGKREHAIYWRTIGSPAVQSSSGARASCSGIVRLCSGGKELPENSWISWFLS